MISRHITAVPDVANGGVLVVHLGLTTSHAMKKGVIGS